MKAFVWDQRFLTGISKVDSQHRELVDMVNEVGDLVIAQDAEPAVLQSLFHRLADYARFHFAEEEKLMAQAGVDTRHSEPHRQHHAEFIRQVLLLWQGRGSVRNPLDTLHAFLTAWLTMHILGEDQAMARILARMHAGASAADAYEGEDVAHDPALSTLLEALHGLYHLVSVQNRDLAEANERLESQVRQRTRELLRVEKLASVGRLAAGVAHEINNPVGFVQSNLASLGDYSARLFGLIDAYEAGSADLPDPRRRETLDEARQKADLSFIREDLPELLEESRHGLERVARIVRRLKDFSRVDQTEVQESDLNTDLENSLQIASHEFRERIEVVRDYGTLPLLRCVPAQLNQVFFNLILNAAQAVEGPGVLTLRTRAHEGWVEVEVADTGRGMAPEVLERIFDPFYTTRPVGQGTGLGLSEAWDIVQRHGGTIQVESAPGQGSTFRVRLPARPATLAAEGAVACVG